MKKQIANKTLWLFAIGQLGWSLLAGIITNWLVFFYLPNETVIAKGLPLYVPQGTVFLGLMVVGLITAGGIGRYLHANSRNIHKKRSYSLIVIR